MERGEKRRGDAVGRSEGQRLNRIGILKDLLHYKHGMGVELDGRPIMCTP